MHLVQQLDTVTAQAISRCFAGVVGVIVTFATASQAHAEVIHQLTQHSDGACVVLAPDSDLVGRFIAFESSCDLTGANGDGNREIFRYDRETRSLEQITDTSGCASTSPAIDGDGDRIVFDSDCDVVGTNIDESIEIYLLDGGTIIQLTDRTLCSNLAPDIDAAGDIIVFDGDCAYDSGNADFSSEIFRVTASGEITQLTFDSSGVGCGSFEASISLDGTLIAFESDCDLAGTNEDELAEVFSVTLQGAVTQMSADLSDSGCTTENPAVDGTGTFVTYESNCDPLGMNQDESIEVFKVELSGATEQLTDDSTDSGCASSKPRISSDGSSIVFVSDCDASGENLDANQEVFRVDTMGTQQLTDTTACANFDAAISGDSGEAVFASDCDLAADNEDGSDELFAIYRCTCGAPVSGLTPPTATDALFALNAAVDLMACALCECDTDDSGSVTATDALLILNASVGIEAPALTCP